MTIGLKNGALSFRISDYHSLVMIKACTAVFGSFTIRHFRFSIAILIKVNKKLFWVQNSNFVTCVLLGFI